MDEHLVRSVIRLGHATGVLRESTSELIAGSDFQIRITEDDRIYQIDLEKVMFSFRNLRERRRMRSIIEDPSERIIDLFAGLGYWTIPLASQVQTTVIACDLNPIQIRLLRQNMVLNQLTNILPIEGDCRQLEWISYADRVIFGLFTDDLSFYRLAERVLRPGGIVHLHRLVIRHGPSPNLQDLFGSPIRILRESFVKTVSKTLVHLVYDIQILKKE